jgi:DNA primase
MAFSWAEYLEANFNVKYSGDFIYLDCVFCNHREKLWINVNAERQWGWCFRCETWTDATKFIMNHRGLDRQEALEFLRRGDYSESLAVALQRPERKLKPKPREEILPPEFTPVPLNPSKSYEKMALKYLRKREVSDVQIVHHTIGYCATGKYYGCIIIPVSRANNVVYFVARAFMRPGVKYLNPSKDDIGTGKTEVIFNYDAARNLGDGIVCEGVFDALAMGARGMAILGKAISDDQLAMLMSFKRLGVCLDNDAKRERLELVETLCRMGVDAYPMSPRGKDANEAHGVVDAGERSVLDQMKEQMGAGTFGKPWSES